MTHPVCFEQNMYLYLFCIFFSAKREGVLEMT